MSPLPRSTRYVPSPGANIATERSYGMSAASAWLLNSRLAKVVGLAALAGLYYATQTSVAHGIAHTEASAVSTGSQGIDNAVRQLGGTDRTVEQVHDTERAILVGTGKVIDDAGIAAGLAGATLASVRFRSNGRRQIHTAQAVKEAKNFNSMDQSQADDMLFGELANGDSTFAVQVAIAYYQGQKRAPVALNRAATELSPAYHLAVAVVEAQRGDIDRVSFEIEAAGAAPRTNEARLHAEAGVVSAMLLSDQIYANSKVAGDDKEAWVAKLSDVNHFGREYQRVNSAAQPSLLPTPSALDFS